MANYYIASVASGGSTSNSGTSSSSPWTFAKAQTLLTTTALPDDNVFFNKGDTFSGQLLVSRSGTSGHPITLDLYGSATNNAVLDGAASTTTPALKITGAFVTVNNLVVQNAFVAPSSGVLFISGTHDVTIFNCYVNTGFRGIHPSHCSGNILISSNYVTNIWQPQNSAGPAFGGGSHIQFDTCTGSGNKVLYNKIWANAADLSGIGDLISLFVSVGTISDYIEVAFNQIRGGGSGTNGYCSIGVGDNSTGLAYQNIHDNLIAKPLYAGIQIAGGDTIIVNNNTVYMPSSSVSLRGVTCYNASPQSPVNVTFTNNKVAAQDISGNTRNYYLAAGVATPTGWPNPTGGGNTPEGTLDAAANNSIIADPLWTGSPWNTVTGGGLISFNLPIGFI